MARNGAVTLINNTISIPDNTCVVALAPGTFGNALDDDATDNERAVAAALDAFLAQGGVLPLGFQFLAGALTPAELAAALAQLSGEAATGTAPTGMEAMDSFLSLVSDAGYGIGGGPSLTPEESNPSAPDTVRVLGYMPKGSSQIASTFDSVDGQPIGSGPSPRLWRIWVGGFGGYSFTDGDATAGSHDRSSRNFGVATGFDRYVTPDVKIGLALAGGGTRFELSDGLGTGRSDMFQAALYARSNFQAAYLAAVVAYALHDVSTDRTAIGEHLTAEFFAHNLAGQIEGGYSFGWFTPYAALRGQVFRTPSYSEEADTGVSILAIDYDERTTTSLRSELGARINWPIAIGDETTLGLRARAAWAHEFWSDESMDAAFQALPGTSFGVSGAESARDSLLVSAGPEISFDSGLALAASFDGEFAETSQTYGGSARLSYRW